MSITNKSYHNSINCKIKQIRSDFKKKHPKKLNMLCVFDSAIKNEALVGAKSGPTIPEDGSLLANHNAVESFAFSETHVIFEMKNGAMIFKKEL